MIMSRKIEVPIPREAILCLVFDKMCLVFDKMCLVFDKMCLVSAEGVGGGSQSQSAGNFCFFSLFSTFLIFFAPMFRDLLDWNCPDVAIPLRIQQLLFLFLKR